MKLTITTPEKTVFDGNISEVYLPGKEGEFGILPGHAEMIAGLRVGVAKIKEENKGEPQKFLLHAGLCQVSEDKIKVLTDALENKEDIMPDRSRQNLKEIENKLLAQDLTEEQRKSFEVERDKEIARLGFISI